MSFASSSVPRAQFRPDGGGGGSRGGRQGTNRPRCHHLNHFYDTRIREGCVVNVMRQFPDCTGWHVAPERFNEHAIGRRLFPRAAFIAGKVISLATDELAHTAAWDEHSDRAFGSA